MSFCAAVRFLWSTKAKAKERGAGAVLALAGLLALGSCAAISSPQGGPRDKTPPRLIATSPDQRGPQREAAVRQAHVFGAHSAQGFAQTCSLPAAHARKLVFGARGPRRGDAAVQAAAGGEHDLFVQLRKAIVDANESLPAKYRALSFSTSATLDSGVVRGTVADLLSGRLAKDAVVGLYRPTDTVGVRRGQPYYLTRTDDKGAFQLNFVRTAPTISTPGPIRTTTAASTTARKSPTCPPRSR
ncbi:MAG: hypothetical protein WKG07_08430 [Hymenobacter sp.]